MKSILKYALIAAGLVIAAKLIIFFTHTQFTGIGIYSGLFSLFLISVPLFMAVKNRRDKELGGYISLMEIAKIGLGIAVITGLIIAVFTYMYYKFIDHEILSHLIEQTKQLGIEQKRTQAEIDTELKALNDFYEPFHQATGVLTGILISGIVFSLIASTFLLKNPQNRN